MVQPLTGRIIPLEPCAQSTRGIHEIVAEHRSPFDSCTMTVGENECRGQRQYHTGNSYYAGDHTYIQQAGWRTAEKKDLVTLVEYVGEGQRCDGRGYLRHCLSPLMVDSNVHKSFLCSMKEMFGDEAWDMRTAWGGSLQQKHKCRGFSLYRRKGSFRLWLDIPWGQPSGTQVGDVIIPRYSLMMPIFTGARLLIILRRQWIGCWKNAAEGTVSDCIRQAEETLYEMAGN